MLTQWNLRQQKERTEAPADMFLTGSFLLIFLAGGLTSSSPPAPVLEDPPGFTATVKTEEDFPVNDYDNTRLPGGLTSSSPPVPVVEDTLGFPDGTVETEEDYPENYNYARFPEGTDDGFGCGMRGTFDGAEFYEAYMVNGSNLPEYLKEYFASLRDVPEPCDMLCNYTELIDELELNKQKEILTMSRPVLSHHILTYVYLEMSIAAILNVKESDQLFVAYIWLYMSWNNQFISWYPEDFCGIKHVIVPSDTLWKPDIIIEEMLEKDKIPPSPFLKINSIGEVVLRTDQVVTGTCHINVYKFPFDTQRCTISFKSLMHTDDELRFVVNTDPTLVSRWAQHSVQSQHEWLFVKMTVTKRTTRFYFGSNQTVIVYTVFMKRIATQHAVNFLLPIFFFLCLDMASFLIPDSGEDKITFRITVLLAVTVLQLILHEILPSSSNKVPLIAVYCVGIFFMMLISLLEAILARYLIQKDSKSQDCKTDGDQSRNSERRVSFCDSSNERKNSSKRSSACPTLADQTPPENNQTDGEKPSEVYMNMTTAADQLEKDSHLLRKEEEEPGYWTGRVKRINRGFFILYLTTATVFYVYMFSLWTAPDED